MGKSLGAPVVVDLHRLEIGEQAADVRRAGGEARGDAGGDQRVELPLVQHVVQGAVVGDGLHLDLRRQPELDAFLPSGDFLAAGEPRDVLGGDPVVVAQETAYPHRRGHGVFRNADTLAAEILGLVQAPGGVDEHAGMAEIAGREDRDGRERALAPGGHGDVVGQRHLGGVELLVVPHAPEDLLGLHRQVVEGDADGIQRAVLQRLGAVVVAARQCQM